MENEDSADEESTEKESEVKCAPWNTTRAYLAVSKGRCLLDQTGVGNVMGARVTRLTPTVFNLIA